MKGQAGFDARQHPDYWEPCRDEPEEPEAIEEDPRHDFNCKCPECEEQEILGEG